MFKNIIENRNLTHIYMTTHVPDLEQELGKMHTPIVVHKPILREGILENIYLC